MMTSKKRNMLKSKELLTWRKVKKQLIERRKKTNEQIKAVNMAIAREVYRLEKEKEKWNG